MSQSATASPSSGELRGSGASVPRLTWKATEPSSRGSLVTRIRRVCARLYRANSSLIVRYRTSPAAGSRRACSALTSRTAVDAGLRAKGVAEPAQPDLHGGETLERAMQVLGRLIGPLVVHVRVFDTWHCSPSRGFDVLENASREAIDTGRGPACDV